LDFFFKQSSFSGEQIFMSAVGYSLGVSAICLLFNFSGEMGAFWAGVSMGTLEYRLEIEHKIEGMKMLGVSLFFIILGFELQFDTNEFGEAIGPALLLCLLVVFVTPWFMFLIGTFNGLTARVTFMNGFVINQISEFSLVLGQMAYGYGIFDKNLYLIVAFAALLSILISSTIHTQLDALYQKINQWPCFKCVNNRAEKKKEQHHEILEDHIVLLGYNEVAQSIMDRFSDTRTVVLVTSDQLVFDGLQHMLPRNRGTSNPDASLLNNDQEEDLKRDKEADDHSANLEMQELFAGMQTEHHGLADSILQSVRPVGKFTSTGSKFKVRYVDYNNPSVWNHHSLSLPTASLIVSCIPSTLTLDGTLASYCSKLDPRVPFVAVANNFSDSEHLYKMEGISFVLQSEQNAADSFSLALDEDFATKGMHKSERLQGLKEIHLQQLKALKTQLGPLFKLQ
jgi:hypothetical protein